MRGVRRRKNVLAILSLGIGLCVQYANAASAENLFVRVVSSTPEVVRIVDFGNDFYVIVTNGNRKIKPKLSIQPLLPWILVKPHGSLSTVDIGSTLSYRVKEDSGSEDGSGGSVKVVKLDIEQSEVNVCHKKTSCSLNLTSDSDPKDSVNWSSVPAGISGRGGTITFNPSSLAAGEYLVKAQSEISSEAVDFCTVRVVQLTTRALASVPEDTLRRRIGVGERVRLTLTPGSLPKVSWSVIGLGELESDKGTATFTAPSRGASTVVKASYPGDECSASFSVVAPSSVTLAKTFGMGKTTPLSVCMLADWYIGPEDVNFEAVVIEEQTCNAQCSGYFEYQTGLEHMPGDALKVTGTLVQGKGWKCAGDDTISGGAIGKPYANGVFKWAIPWHYKVNGESYLFATVDQVKKLAIGADGKATLTISKQGATHSQKEP